ncbi:MAG: cupin domain-containing protein [Dehalococcoidia bacterium]
MSGEPTVSPAIIAGPGEPIAGAGGSFELHEWGGAPGRGPGIPLHVHHRGDEAWHVLEGVLRFRFADRSTEAIAGTTVFVPAGVAHTFSIAGPGDARYLIAMSTQIAELIAALHEPELRDEDVAAVYRRFDSEIVAESEM